MPPKRRLRRSPSAKNHSCCGSDWQRAAAMHSFIVTAKMIGVERMERGIGTHLGWVAALFLAGFGREQNIARVNAESFQQRDPKLMR
jgi:hypothetical protein